MSKREHARFNLKDYKERKADEGAIDVELWDGHVMRIPPPELWPDEIGERIQAERDGGEKFPPNAMAAAIVGADELDRFIADGGTVTLFMTFMKDGHQLDVGESSAS